MDPSFLKNESLIAFIAGIIVFSLTLLLVVKRWIGFSFAVILLLFALAAGFLISHHYAIGTYMEGGQHVSVQTKEDAAFQEKVWKAIEDLKVEFTYEKDKIALIKTQIEDVIKDLDTQKQQLQIFMEETNTEFDKKDTDSIPQ
ncbi:MAG: hypothetical protein LW832_03400 [Parachlamydia sp.]|jgi:preprotein translocase subunit SecF|nr:hypothetical protein [Parachlamydia sp.]